MSDSDLADMVVSNRVTTTSNTGVNRPSEHSTGKPYIQVGNGFANSSIDNAIQKPILVFIC